jgi:phage terminase large subunit-like protein
MVEHVISNVKDAHDVSYKEVRASRGKELRAEPVQALYEKSRVHHMGAFPDLEDEMCTWVPGQSKWSPNRVDALVYAVSDLIGLDDWVIS